MGVYSLTLIMGKLTLGKYMIEILCTFQNVNRVKSETVRRGGRALSGGDRAERAQNRIFQSLSALLREIDRSWGEKRERGSGREGR